MIGVCHVNGVATASCPDSRSSCCRCVVRHWPVAHLPVRSDFQDPACDRLCSVRTRSGRKPQNDDHAGAHHRIVRRGRLCPHPSFLDHLHIVATLHGRRSCEGRKLDKALWARALRPASPAAVALIGMNIGVSMGGSLIVENIFGIPGIGRLSVTALQGRDIPMLQGIVVFATLCVLAMSIVVDLVSYLLNPKGSYGRE